MGCCDSISWRISYAKSENFTTRMLISLKGIDVMNHYG